MHKITNIIHTHHTHTVHIYHMDTQYLTYTTPHAHTHWAQAVHPPSHTMKLALMLCIHGPYA